MPLCHRFELAMLTGCWRLASDLPGGERSHGTPSRCCYRGATRRYSAPLRAGPRMASNGCAGPQSFGKIEIPSRSSSFCTQFCSKKVTLQIHGTRCYSADRDATRRSRSNRANTGYRVALGCGARARSAPSLRYSTLLASESSAFLAGAVRDAIQSSMVSFRAG